MVHIHLRLMFQVHSLRGKYTHTSLHASPEREGSGRPEARLAHVAAVRVVRRLLGRPLAHELLEERAAFQEPLALGGIGVRPDRLWLSSTRAEADPTRPSARWSGDEALPFNPLISLMRLRKPWAPRWLYAVGWCRNLATCE